MTRPSADVNWEGTQEPGKGCPWAAARLLFLLVLVLGLVACSGHAAADWFIAFQVVCGCPGQSNGFLCGPCKDWITDPALGQVCCVHCDEPAQINLVERIR